MMRCGRVGAGVGRFVSFVGVVVADGGFDVGRGPRVGVVVVVVVVVGSVVVMIGSGGGLVEKGKGRSGRDDGGGRGW